MPLDGNGNYTRARDWTTDDGNALNIEAALFDEHDDDLATALNTAFYRDGQASATGTFDMDGNKIDLDGDQDTSIHASTDDQIDFEIGGTDVLRMTTAGIIPVTAGMALPGFISGLVPSLDTDTSHDINITSGMATDSTSAFSMFLTSEITKRIDATWAVGDDAGGLFTGSVANSTWYHLFVIRRSDSGVVDAGFDTSVTAANIPTNYDAFRRVGSVLTDGSANILAFVAEEIQGGGIEIHWDVAQTGFSTTDPGTTRVTQALTGIPTGYKAIPNMFVNCSSAQGDEVSVLFTESGQTDTTPSSTRCHMYDDSTSQAGVWEFGAFVRIHTNTSAQVLYRLDNSGVTVSVTAIIHGWTDPRR